MASLSEFMSLGETARALQNAANPMEQAAERAVERICKILVKESKSAIGHYRPDYNWPQLAQSTQAERARLGYAPNEPLLRTGELRDSIGWQAPFHEMGATVGYVFSTSEIAVYHELGTSKIPPRSFLLPALALKMPQIERILASEFERGIADIFHKWRMVFELGRKAIDELRELGPEDEDERERR
jgi:hypothetical protein